MNVERLNYLEVLMQRKMAEDYEKFFMGTWAQVNNSSKPVDLCNTASCALGTAALDPKCIADGLVLEANYPNDEGDRERFSLTSKEAWARISDVDPNVIDFLPKFQDEFGFVAGMLYYGITAREADYLFDPSEYHMPTDDIGPEHVIARIHDVLNGCVPLHDEEEDEDEAGQDEDDNDDDAQASPSEGFV